jgi:hypothetical protein
MAALLGGFVSLILGVIGIIIWWGYFIKALMAAVPAMLILGGALAAYLGFEELRDKRAAENFDESSDLKQEVESLKAEVQELKSQPEKPETESEN